MKSITQPLFSTDVVASRRLGRAAILLPAALALAACATLSPADRNSYAQAKSQVQQLESEPLASEAAGMPLQRARTDLANADVAAAHDNADALRYWSYLASREAETGQAMVDERQARNQIASATAERERTLMDFQRRRAEVAQQRASTAEQRAQQAESQLQQVQQQHAQEEAQAQVDQAHQQAEQSAAQAQQQIQQAQAQTDDARKREDEERHDLENLQARQTAQGMMLTLSGSVLFATGRDALEPGAAPALSSVAAFLQQHPTVKIRVEGFTDNRGTDALNDALSQRRAQAVAAALESDGVDPARLMSIGRGASLPIASNADSAGRQQNRRVELLFSDTEGRFASNGAGEALR